MALTFDDIDRLVEKSGDLPDDPLMRELREKRKEPFIWENYFNFFYYLVKELKPQFCLEIGVGLSFNSISMAIASEGWVLGVDRNGVKIKTPLRNPQNYIFINASSTDPEAFKMVKKITDGRIGLIYQDASHLYLPSKKEWELYRGLLVPGGVWMCDDITPAFYDPEIDPPGKGMVQYWEEIEEPNKKLYSNLHCGSVQGVILT